MSRPDLIALKEWNVDIWLVLRNGQPFDYAFSRSSAFAKAKEQRAFDPKRFWSIAPATGTLSIKALS